MIKGLAITPPIIGRISIGHIVERNGKRLPEKDDFFTITTQVQTRDGWMIHPLQNKLVDATTSPNTSAKLRAIPVKLLFNAPDLNLRAQYSLFDRDTGRPVCVGDGLTAKRATDEGIQDLNCPSPEACEYGRQGACKLFGRLNVQIEGQDDDLGSFIFRTTGYNSIRTLFARLQYFNAVSGNNARHLPLLLRLRAKSTTLSRRTPVYYADLTLRENDTLTEAVCFARAEALRQAEAGVETARLEDAARQVLANGSFEENEEEAPAIVDEFYPEPEPEPDQTEPVPQPVPEKTRLTQTRIRPTKLTRHLGTPAPSGSTAANQAGGS